MCYVRIDCFCICTVDVLRTDRYTLILNDISRDVPLGSPDSLGSDAMLEVILQLPTSLHQRILVQIPFRFEVKDEVHWFYQLQMQAPNSPPKVDLFAAAAAAPNHSMDHLLGIIFGFEKSFGLSILMHALPSPTYLMEHKVLSYKTAA